MICRYCWPLAHLFYDRRCLLVCMRVVEAKVLDTLVDRCNHHTARVLEWERERIDTKICGAQNKKKKREDADQYWMSLLDRWPGAQPQTHAHNPTRNRSTKRDKNFIHHQQLRMYVIISRAWSDSSWMVTAAGKYFETHQPLEMFPFFHIWRLIYFWLRQGKASLSLFSIGMYFFSIGCPIISRVSYDCLFLVTFFSATLYLFGYRENIKHFQGHWIWSVCRDGTDLL